MSGVFDLYGLASIKKKSLLNQDLSRFIKIKIKNTAAEEQKLGAQRERTEKLKDRNKQSTMKEIEKKSKRNKQSTMKETEKKRKKSMQSTMHNMLMILEGSKALTTTSIE